MAPPVRTKTKFREAKITTQTLLDFDLEESSSDSDFRIEDHDQESDDDFSDNSNAVDSGKDDDEDDDDEDGGSDSDDDSSGGFSDFKASLVDVSAKKSGTVDYKTAIETAKKISLKDALTFQLPTNPICCACLGDRSDDTNEIVECDGCGVSVHEGCYGVSDSNSVSSTVSSCSTEPWFCEACRAGVTEPTCELCPNTGGIFKETDVGRWVHLICALYVPGVAFGEVDQLSSVTLFEMPYSKWGAKTCSLCEDTKFARTGVCIGCDAGMCKTYFHVTCAQAAGFLSEAHSEEADHADPFYAHCKVHSDKTMIKHRKRNFNTLKLRMEQKKFEKANNKDDKPSAEQLRIQRKLAKHQNKYRNSKLLKTEPWVPTQKMPRLLTTSATACKRLMLKAKLMGIDTAAMEFQEAQMVALADVRKKWHIPPAFSVEFIGYYLDRISRLKNLKTSLERNADTNKKLLEEQQTLRDEYDKIMKIHTEKTAKKNDLKNRISELHKQILSLCPTKVLPDVENIGQSPVVQSPQPSTPSARPMSVPTAAALKMGVGFPLKNLPGTKEDSGRILSTQRSSNNELVHECGICKRCHDQHMLAKCDTCKFYYHLGCLNPPLTRHPKKSKLYGWQCSECDKSDDSDTVVPLPKGPRKSRTRFSKDGSIVPVDPNYSASSNDGSYFKSIESSAEKVKPADKLTNSLKGKQMTSDVPAEVQTEKQVKDTNTISKGSASKITKKAKPNDESVSQSGKKDENSSLPKEQVKENNVIKEIERIASPRPSRIQSPKLSLIQSPRASRIQSPKAARIQSPRPNETPAKTQVEKDPLALDNIEARKDAKQKSIKKIKKDKNDQNVQEINGKDNETIEISDDEINELGDASQLSVDETMNDDQMDDKNINESGAADQSHRHNRKRRKDKHKNKYSSDNEKSPSKEHKRKRKKKSHDTENPNDSIPKIKIKFKTLPLPGEIAPEPQCFYVSADMVRPKDTSRPTSVETVDDSTTNADDMKQSFSPLLDKSLTPVIKKIDPTIAETILKMSSPIQKPARIASPRKSNKRSSIGNASGDGKNTITGVTACDVCGLEGTNQNVVKCDECLKNYHFTCLDPPLKKTPKRRGYSWHCADCDPTDIESSDMGFK